jgi:hypothetical protein
MGSGLDQLDAEKNMPCEQLYWRTIRPTHDGSGDAVGAGQTITLIHRRSKDVIAARASPREIGPVGPRINLPAVGHPKSPRRCPARQQGQSQHAPDVGLIDPLGGGNLANGRVLAALQYVAPTDTRAIDLIMEQKRQPALCRPTWVVMRVEYSSKRNSLARNAFSAMMSDAASAEVPAQFHLLYLASLSSDWKLASRRMFR